MRLASGGSLANACNWPAGVRRVIDIETKLYPAEGAPANYGQQLAQQVRVLVDYAPYAEYGDWEKIVTALFVDADLKSYVLEVLASGAAGLLRRRKRDEKGSLWQPWCDEQESEVDAGEPPSAVPGLVDYLRQETLRQYGLRVLPINEPDPLFRAGLSQLPVRPKEMHYEILRFGVLLRGLAPGQTMIITGPPRSGKTYMAVQDVIAPGLQQGYHIVSNIMLLERIANYHYVRTLSDALLAILDILLADPKARIMFVRDEGAIGRKRSKAQSQRNQDQAMLTMILGKLGVIEIVIYQIAGDVPTELKEFCTHRLVKPSPRRKDRALIVSPIEGLHLTPVQGIPNDEGRRELGQPVLLYDTRDIAKLKHDLAVMPLLEYQEVTAFRKLTDGGQPDASAPETAMPTFEEQLRALRKYIVTIKGKNTGVGTTTDEDLLHMIQVLHHNQPKKGFRWTFKCLKEEAEALGHTDWWIYDVAWPSLKIRSHGLRRDEWCEWCDTHRRDAGPTAVP